MRLWEENKILDDQILDFTVGDDHILDQRLVRYDCLASMAHARMLHKIQVLTLQEADQLVEGLSAVIRLEEIGEFKITKDQEDCHTAIESYLTEKYGDVGKKIHLGRSRNDQVLTALRLYEKDNLSIIRSALQEFSRALLVSIERHGSTPIPGYTHMRKAMPATVGMWWGSFESAVQDDLSILGILYKLVDRSPLGTAAGFGVPVFELDRKMTAELMGFSAVLENPMYAQLSRGKIEVALLSFLTGVMFVLNRLAADLLLFSMDEFGFVTLPPEFCTGSSIMPQKKNPDVLELVRAKYHVVCGEDLKLKTLSAGLMSGYQRDLQLGKKSLFVAFDTTLEAINISTRVLSGIQVNASRCRAALTEDLYTTEKAYKLVKKGVPFREAYHKVKKELSGSTP